MPKAKVGDINIYYEVHGEGEPLVLIQGWGGSSGQWYREVPFLSREYRVITFDNRGTGRSDKPDIPYTMEMMAGDIAGLLEAIGVDKAHIYGASMGGMIAQEFALGHPDMVVSLILRGTSCGGTHTIQPGDESLVFLAHQIDIERRKRLTPEDAAMELLPFLCSQEFIDSNPDIIEPFVARATEYVTPPHGYQRQVEAIMLHDTYDRLPQIKAPTLVIAGTGDRLVPFENSKLLASRVPNAELVILEDVGHGFFEAAEEANKAVLDFLERHRRSR